MMLQIKFFEREFKHQLKTDPMWSRIKRWKRYTFTFTISCCMTARFLWFLKRSKILSFDRVMGLWSSIRVAGILGHPVWHIYLYWEFLYNGNNLPSMRIRDPNCVFHKFLNGWAKWMLGYDAEHVVFFKKFFHGRSFITSALPSRLFYITLPPTQHTTHLQSENL